jgi:RHS repeat-associated protein
MMQPGRTFSTASGYRYGFNGKEKSAEIANDDYDYGTRIYNARIARWLSIDPLQKKYPAISPFAFSLNSPNFYYDADGRDVGVSIAGNPQGGGTITFYTTTYVTGISAEQKVIAFNEAYKAFAKANPDMKSSDGKWKVE